MVCIFTARQMSKNTYYCERRHDDMHFPNRNIVSETNLITFGAVGGHFYSSSYRKKSIFDVFKVKPEMTLISLNGLQMKMILMMKK